MSSYDSCKKCRAALGADDIAINRKLISRNVTDFYCIDCLAEYYNTCREAIEERIEYYRKSGHCTLFK